MGVLDLIDYSKCFYYECGDSPIIELLQFEGGHTRKPTFEKNKIVFVIEGGLRLTYKCHPEVIVEKGWFCFVPSSEEIIYTTTQQSQIFVVRLQDYNFLCGGCRIEQLFDNMDECRKNGVMHDPSIGVLQINKMLWRFLDGLYETVNDGLNCRFYYEVKIKEMSTLLSVYYSRQELRELFSPVLSPDMEYSEYVRRNHYKFRSVNELAASMHLTPKNFAKKFIGVFGETPHQWMNKERARRIYAELFSGRKSFMEVADEYGFLSQAHFNKYCKREFSKTPGEIRKRENV